ncbi:phosphoribosylamine--glycine ligase [Actinospongicola halichondriae]|uniref:phosphoribosylamine--glycine ligase n=1 Tax=Actinospongicola halichondriae TaxID=3236844 RepID=UPI003D4442CB
MKVVVVGSGGREHALVSVLSRTAEVVITPGSPGIPGSVDTPPEELDADLFVIGPEAPLVDGLADRLRAQGKSVFGPGADGAQMEGSKAWMKEVVAAAGVPTARYGAFDQVEPALDFLRSLPGPYVVKTDGLAAGKGVLVTADLVEAEDDVRAKLAGDAFGSAGHTVVIEEFLDGPELSILAVCDGHKAVALAPAQDFKRVGDDDTGPNTGGMGAYSPVPSVDDDMVQAVLDDFVAPTLAELRRRGIDYRGTLYAGLMLTDDGPKLIEYNARFGDPESQVVLPRITSDLARLLAEAAAGSIEHEPTFTDDACVTVACASALYPATPRVGDVIRGHVAAGDLDGVQVFFAGVRAEGDDLVTSGGRVLYVTGTAPTIEAARAKAYEGVERITWDGMHHRSDIAADPT